MKYKHLKLNDLVSVIDFSIKAKIIYIKTTNGITKLTLMLPSGFRWCGSFPANKDI